MLFRRTSRGHRPIFPICSLVLALFVHASHASTDNYHREGLVEVGVGYVSDASFRYGKYSGLVNERAEPLLDLRLEGSARWDSGATGYWRLEGDRLGLESRRLALEAGQRGSQRLRLFYRESPRYLFEDGQTPFRGAGSSVLTLPPDWTASGNTTAGMDRLAQSLGTLRIHQDRRQLGLDYRRELSAQWRLELDYRYETREGRRVAGGVIGSNAGNARAALLPAPVDYETHRFAVVTSLRMPDYHLSLGYQGSLFNNNRDGLTWDNPFGSQPQWASGVGHPDGQGRIALEPENRAHQLTMSGSYRFGRTGSASLSLARGRMTQDADFLPYTVNPALSVSEALPRSSLNGRIDTTRINLRVNGRPLARLNLSGSYRYDDRDNRTPAAAYRHVPGDAHNQVGADSARINRPYSYSEHQLSADARYRVSRGVRLQAGYQYRDIDRDFSEITRSEEHSYSAGLRLRAIDNLSLSADYRHQRRDSGRYVGNRPLLESHLPGTVAPDDFENHPLLRKYYLADRDRDQWQLRGDLALSEQLSLGVSGSYSRDDYHDTVFGLNEATVKSWGTDLAYLPAAHTSVTLFYSLDRFDSEQSGRSFGPSPQEQADPARNWHYGNRDRFQSAGLNLEIDHFERWLGPQWRGGLPGRIQLELELLRANSVGKIDVASGSALATEPLPDFRTRLNRAGVAARYHMSDASSLRLGIEHERYRSRDFALDGVQPDTVANVLNLGERSPRYSINWLFVSYAYRF